MTTKPDTVTASPFHRMTTLVVAVTVVVSLTACGDDEDRSGAPGTTSSAVAATIAPNTATSVRTAPTSQSVALQAQDVPEGFQACSYSGPMDDYLNRVKALDESASATAASVWQHLRDAGAVEGHVAVFADTPHSCERWVKGSPEGSGQAAVKVAQSIVVRFGSTEAAIRAHGDDIFGQTRLLASPGGISGEDTGLGPNSITGGSEAPGASSYHAVWQRDVFNVFLRGENLSRPEFAVAAKAVNPRIIGSGYPSNAAGAHP